jgi:hypothetical protein
VSKKLRVTERMWVADNGSIYTADTDELKIDFTRQSIQVRKSIAFNLHPDTAEHIVQLHNQSICHPG